MITAARVTTVVMAALGLAGFSAAPAAAEAANGDMVPLGAKYRSCDFTKLNFVSPTGAGSGTAVIGTGGTNTVTAEVFLAIAIPNTPYQVRLIQGPLPRTQKCNAGDPGVTSTVMNTDGNGVGRVTLRAAVRPGATNAWVFIDGPPDIGQIRGEYYTSDLLTSLQ